MKFRKIDYIIFYILVVLFYIMQSMSLTAGIILAIVTVAIIPALILGTITNFIFKKR
jgi:hypothetical protein